MSAEGASDVSGVHCEFRPVLRALLADPNADPEAWLEHIAECESCRVFAEEELQSGVVERGLIGASADLVADEIRSLTPEVPGYTILGELGSGGQGVVYKARQEGANGRHVALKVIYAGSSKAAQERIDRECSVLGQLEIPGIVRLYDSGEADGRRWIAMEIVSGQHMDVWFRAEGVTLRDRIAALASVSRTVQDVHDRGIVHRDLKPPNILVDENGAAVVLDFGLGRPAEIESTDDWRFTATGGFAGTVAFAAPEQLDGKTDERSDVYALGVLAYIASTGEHPFCRIEGIMPLLNAIQAGEFDSPARRSSGGVDRDLDAVIRRAMSSRMEERYESAGAFADDLDRWLAGDTVRATEGARLDAVRRVVRRFGPRIVAACLAALLVWQGAVFGLDLVQKAGSARAESDALEALFDLRSLAGEEAGLWPIAPGLIPRAEDWLSRASAALEGLDLIPVEARQGTAALEDAANGLRSHIASVRWRVERSATVARHSADDEVWDELLRSMGEGRYLLTRVEKAPGLVPIRRNDVTGLWEAWHVASGDRPVWDEENGAYGRLPGDGLVFVLVPTIPHPHLAGVPGVPEGRRLLPHCWVAKHPLSTAQWPRFSGHELASATGPWKPILDVPASEAGTALARLGLTAPSGMEMELIWAGWETISTQLQPIEMAEMVELLDAVGGATVAATMAPVRIDGEISGNNLGLVGNSICFRELLRTKGAGGGVEFRYSHEVFDDEQCSAWIRPVLPKPTVER